MPEGRDFIRVLLSPGSHEYKDVERLFCQTMSPDRSTIIKIERVQNQEMWNSYERLAANCKEWDVQSCLEGGRGGGGGWGRGVDVFVGF